MPSGRSTRYSSAYSPPVSSAVATDPATRVRSSGCTRSMNAETGRGTCSGSPAKPNISSSRLLPDIVRAARSHSQLPMPPDSMARPSWIRMRSRSPWVAARSSSAVVACASSSSTVTSSSVQVRGSWS